MTIKVKNPNKARSPRSRTKINREATFQNEVIKIKDIYNTEILSDIFLFNLEV